MECFQLSEAVEELTGSLNCRFPKLPENSDCYLDNITTTVCVLGIVITSWILLVTN